MSTGTKLQVNFKGCSQHLVETHSSDDVDSATDDNKSFATKRGETRACLERNLLLIGARMTLLRTTWGEAACNCERCFLSSLENLVRAIVSSFFNIISSYCFHCYFRFLTFSYRFKFSLTVTYPFISIHFLNSDVLTLIFCQVFHK